jgi:hypothetical protein
MERFISCISFFGSDAKYCAYSTLSPPPLLGVFTNNPK